MGGGSDEIEKGEHDDCGHECKDDPAGRKIPNDKKATYRIMRRTTEIGRVGRRHGVLHPIGNGGEIEKVLGIGIFPSRPGSDKEQERAQKEDGLHGRGDGKGRGRGIQKPGNGRTRDETRQDLELKGGGGKVSGGGLGGRYRVGARDGGDGLLGDTARDATRQAAAVNVARVEGQQQTRQDGLFLGGITPGHDRVAGWTHHGRRNDGRRSHWLFGDGRGSHQGRARWRHKVLGPFDQSHHQEGAHKQRSVS